MFIRLEVVGCFVEDWVYTYDECVLSNPASARDALFNPTFIEHIEPLKSKDYRNQIPGTSYCFIRQDKTHYVVLGTLDEIEAKIREAVK